MSMLAKLIEYMEVRRFLHSCPMRLDGDATDFQK